MKKIFLLSMSVGLLILSQSCKKEMPSQSPGADAAAVIADAGKDAGRPGQCRLANYHYEEAGISFLFQYNNLGLVNNFTIDYGDGLPDVFNFTYNSNGIMNGGTVDYNYNDTHYDLKLFHAGNKTVRELWYDRGTTNIAFDIRNTYNFRGEITKRNNIVTNTYCSFTYNFLGNSPRTSYYEDGELIAQYDYTFQQFNRNPWTSVNGLTTGVPALYLIFTRWWETSEKTTLYDNGVPEVIEDINPAETVMELGQQGYLASIKNHDRITDEDNHTNFEFENCGGCPSHLHAPRSTITGSSMQGKRMTTITKIKRLLIRGQSTSIKEEMNELRNQLNRIK